MKKQFRSQIRSLEVPEVLLDTIPGPVSAQTYGAHYSVAAFKEGFDDAVRLALSQWDNVRLPNVLRDYLVDTLAAADRVDCSSLDRRTVSLRAILYKSGMIVGCHQALELVQRECDPLDDWNSEDEYDLR